MLRPYQEETLAMLYRWLEDNTGNPCIDLPPGAGKSIITAAIAKDAMQKFGMKKVLMLTHRKELIEQNYEKMRLLWPGAPLGIYSASVGRKESYEPIVFAGIQSIQKRHDLLGKVDLVICDECHLISHKDEGGYRSFIRSLYKVNPDLRVIGLSATPWRLGHGLITDKPAIFDDIIKPITIAELIAQGYLAPLRSKATVEHLDTVGVQKKGGEYVSASLQEAVDKADQNVRVVEEVITFAGDRKKWIFFCSGVKHAEHIAEELRRHDIPAECVTEATPKSMRAKILKAFRDGTLKALTGADILTTGFDCPDIDLIVLLRPTMSPGLYVQMVGRGTRLKSHTDHCLVLDFAGVVAEHGPVTMVQPPKKAGKGNGEAPVKLCDSCAEICHAAARVCPCCGYQFPPPKEKELFLHGECIMGIENTQAMVEKWSFHSYMTVKEVECLLVKYFIKGKKSPITEYLLVYHPGWVGQDANRTLKRMAVKTIGMPALASCMTITEVAKAMNKSKSPSIIEYKKDGKYPKILDRRWHDNTSI